MKFSKDKFNLKIPFTRAWGIKHIVIKLENHIEHHQLEDTEE